MLGFDLYATYYTFLTTTDVHLVIWMDLSLVDVQSQSKNVSTWLLRRHRIDSLRSITLSSESLADLQLVHEHITSEVPTWPNGLHPRYALHEEYSVKVVDPQTWVPSGV